jgi:hypothetical protein
MRVSVPVQMEMETAFPITVMERTHYEATEALWPEEKVAILRRHLLDKELISKLCDEMGPQPAVFYR